MKRQPGGNTPSDVDFPSAVRQEQARKVVGSRIKASQIDVLRVLAMAGVFMHHWWRGGKESGIIEFGITAVAHAGRLGVVMFNFITGFVLALPYLGPEKRPSPSYSEFMQRRFLRIVPPYHLALILFTLLNVVIFTPTRYFSTLLRFLKNFFFLQGLDPSTLMTNLAAYWYLTLLASFYLVFPWVLYLFRRLGPQAAGLVLCSICWGGLALQHVLAPDWRPLSGMLYFNLPARLPEFAMGMWLAAAWKPETARARDLPLDRPFLLFLLALALFALLGASFAQSMAKPLSLIYQAACSFTFFVALFVLPGVIRLGEWDLMVKVSSATYGIYLVHQPLCTYAGFWLGGNLNHLTKALLVLVTMAPASYLVSRVLERLAHRIVTCTAARTRFR